MNIDVQWFDQLDSTQEESRRVLQMHPDASNIVIAAREQLKGHGRQGRKWHTSTGKDLAFSIILPVNVPQNFVPSLPMVAAVALQNMLSDVYSINATVKWPNDVLVAGKKIAGILTEVISVSANNAIILGIGLNVGMTEQDSILVQPPATSIFMLTGKPDSIETALDIFLKEFFPLYQKWCNQGFDSVRVNWETSGLYQRGAVVRLRHSPDKKHGVFDRYGTDGQLILIEDDGTEFTVWSAELL